MPAYHDDPLLHVLLIGAGRRGVDWLATLAGPGAAALGLVLIGVCDVDPGPADQGILADAPWGVTRTSDLGAALALSPDLVIDATSPVARLAMTREAMRSGAHVLCDPPLAMEAATALTLTGAAARGAGYLGVAYLGRHRAGLRQLRMLVETGGFGQARALCASLPLAEAAAPRMLLRGPAADAMDAARAILGRDARSVRCTPSPLSAVFDMDDGVTFSLRSDPSTEAWCLDLEGGRATWHADAPVVTTPTGPMTMPAGSELPPRLRALSNFVTAIRQHRPPESGARSASASLAMALAAIDSAAQGGSRVTVLHLGWMGDASDSPAPRALSTRTPEVS